MLFGLPLAALPQDLEPRQYANVPVGLNFLVAGVALSEGGVLVDPAIVLEDAELDMDGAVLGYVRTFGFRGWSSKLDGAVSHVCLTGSATFASRPVSRDVCGIADAKVRWSFNFLGAPALPPERFPRYRQDLVLGASVALSVPIGDYDPTRLVNIGTNRWAAKLELGLSKAVGRWTVDAALAGTFYEENDDFFGGRRRKQDPILALQAHVVRGFASGVWLAVDMTHYRGGRTVTEGTPDVNHQSNARLGLTVSLPISARQSLKAYMSSGLATRTGTDFDTLGVAWQYRWSKRP